MPVRKRLLDFLAVVTPGLEEVAKEELTALGVEVSEEHRGGLGFRAEMLDAMRVNLHARCVGRLWLRMGRFRAGAVPELYNRTAKLPWARRLAPESVVVLRAHAQRSRLIHTGRIMDAVRDAINTLVPIKVVAEADAPPEAQRILIRLVDNQCEISLDTSGALLHRRGYRQQTGRAPLRETTAAALLRWAQWDGTTPLVDPMCGSGTFVLEGALMAAKKAPGAERRFAFEFWRKYDAYNWRRLGTEAKASEDFGAVPLLMGSDRNAEAIKAARGNATRAGLTQHINFQNVDVQSVRIPISPAGLLVCNPPYGTRIGSRESLDPVYRQLGARIKALTGWRAMVLSADSTLRKTLVSVVKRRPLKEVEFDHGGLKVTTTLF